MGAVQIDKLGLGDQPVVGHFLIALDSATGLPRMGVVLVEEAGLCWWWLVCGRFCLEEALEEGGVWWWWWLECGLFLCVVGPGSGC